jgi:predicted PurR-regulated permease PerM
VKPPQDAIGSWVQFAGFVLVVAVLYFAQAVLVPIALAVLLTFLLAPLVTRVQRFIGPTPAILAVVILTGSVLALAGWTVTRQLGALADELPGYRENIREKIADVRGAGRGGSVEKVQQTIEEIQAEMADEEGPGTFAQPIVVTSQESTGFWGFPAWIGSVVEPLANAGLVIVLVIFMLAERQQLRDRLIGLFGHGHLAVTTKAFDEAGTRISRYLLMQSLVNLIFGVGVAIGLWLIGVPYPLLWASLAAVLRFIPYVGPWIGAGAPILVSLAALPGWTQPLYVIALFVCLELFTNLVLEVFLYAGAAGVSPLGLLVAVAFWTWLWGPFGLLMATPLTVCLVVLGKHVPRLEFMSTLMADTPALAPVVSYYQRLLARDQGEASDLIERHVKAHPAESVWDALVLPALNYAERDRLEGRLSPDEETAVIDASRELIADAAALVFTAKASGLGGEGDDVEGAAPVEQPAPPHITVAGCPASSAADELALRVLGHLAEDDGITIEMLPVGMLSSDLIAAVKACNCRIVCFADLPPSPASKARYLVKKLKTALPDVHVVVGRWAPADIADESTSALTEVGAAHVSASVLETRDQLRVLRDTLVRAGATGGGVQAA